MKQKNRHVFIPEMGFAGQEELIGNYDANYIPNEENANNYMVHESHI
jgi:hypothetical protein